MKRSFYNYIYHENGKSYFFNGISHSHILMSEKLGLKVEELLSIPSKIEKASLSLYEKLLSVGFIIDDDTLEIDKIRTLSENAINQKNYFLIVIPTMNCNLSCYYCTQEHIPSKMSEETILKVKNHIRYMIEEEKISSLMLEWFGGEPFIYFSEVIKPITEYAKELCEKANIPFTSGATTNATLISNEISKQFKNLNFNKFQITIDGDRELHNSIKFNCSIHSAFDTTLYNIVNILKNNPSCHITLRINYGKETLKHDINTQVTSIIPIEYRNRVSIILKKIWQEEVDVNRAESYLNTLDGFRDSHFDISNLNLTLGFLPCYVNKKYYSTINYNGACIKCTNNDSLYTNRSYGSIADNGKILWDEEYEKNTTSVSFENPHCLPCKWLPICMSHCPENVKSLKEWKCKLKSQDIQIKDMIIAHIDYIESKHNK